MPEESSGFEHCERPHATEERDMQFHEGIRSAGGPKPKKVMGGIRREWWPWWAMGCLLAENVWGQGVGGGHVPPGNGLVSGKRHTHCLRLCHPRKTLDGPNQWQQRWQWDGLSWWVYHTWLPEECPLSEPASPGRGIIHTWPISAKRSGWDSGRWKNPRRAWVSKDNQETRRWAWVLLPLMQHHTEANTISYEKGSCKKVQPRSFENFPG